jgi:hypothetical protein
MSVASEGQAEWERPSINVMIFMPWPCWKIDIARPVLSKQIPNPPRGKSNRSISANLSAGGFSPSRKGISSAGEQ